MKTKLLVRHWVVVGISVLIGVGAYLGISETAHEREESRQVELARSQDRAIDHVCEQWRADSAQFSDCGRAYRIYEKCAAAMSRMMDRDGIMDAAGVSCEHPTYRFHAREQKEIEDAMQGQH